MGRHCNCTVDVLLLLELEVQIAIELLKLDVCTLHLNTIPHIQYIQTFLEKIDSKSPNQMHHCPLAHTR